MDRSPNRLNVNNSNTGSTNYLLNVDSIEQKLEQNEKIMQIYSESLLHSNHHHSRAGSSVSMSSGSSSSDSILTEHQTYSAASPILKLFAKQLLTLTKNCSRSTHPDLYIRHPSLRVWLKLLNITPATLDAILSHGSFHDLYDISETDLRSLLASEAISASEHEIQLISSSFQNLRAFYKNLEKCNSTVTTPNCPPASSLSTTPSSSKPADLNNNSVPYSPLLNAYSNQTHLSTNPQNATSTSGQSPGQPVSSGSSSSSSELLNSSNSNESQLSSSSTSSISSENKNAKNSKITETPPRELTSQPDRTATSRREPSPAAKQHTKSESDTVVWTGSESLDLDSDALQLPQATESTTNNKQRLNSISPSSTSQSVIKNLTFSPQLPLKQTNQKKSPGQQKVTTPPPFRKLSTGPMINSAQIHALAAAAAKFKADQQTPSDSNTAFTFDPVNAIVPHNIQRSSSHESHLRNKIHPSLIQNSGNLVANITSAIATPKSNKKTSSINSCERINGSGEYIHRGPSGQASPLNAPSPTHKHANLFSDEYFKNNSLSIPKSPLSKQFRDHRWMNTFKVANCGVCNKKMIIGIKCRTCKFRCHKECERKFQESSPNCPSVFMTFLPAPIDSNLNQNSLTASNESANTTGTSNTANYTSAILQSSLISSSSSGGSSTLPSPALINKTSIFNSQLTDISTQTKESTEYQQQNSWPSGASKVARVANKIVNSINSVSTPKSARKATLPNIQQPCQQQIAQLLTSPYNESQSSSCNSSCSNSPSYLKHTQQQDKKSSSSSNSTSSVNANGNNNNNNNSNGATNNKHNYFNYNNPSLSPIAPKGCNTPSPLARNVEFFGVNPIIKRTTSSDSNQLDDSVDTASENNNNNNNSNNNGIQMDPGNSGNAADNTGSNTIQGGGADEGSKASKEPLDLKRSNNSTVVDSNNDGDTDPYSEYETSDQLLSQDFKQFNITYEEITNKEIIGSGRFGCVYKAQWHGPHAVKEIEFDENLTEESKELINFKQEVVNLKKIRHANLILFVGACMDPPKCAIVMSLHNRTLHTLLHTECYQKNFANFEWTVDIATQIAQGMGYLHNKGMIHKDLRSKNIFIDGYKAVIADFGLYSITKLCKKALKRTDLLPITKECVYYMAPELVRLIGTKQIDNAFSQASDVFSFGTVWYELFSFEYPFQSNSTDTVIYLIGNGLKNISPSIQIPKEFKNILLKCWSKDASARPTFSHLLEFLRNIPKRKLFRSPSHPIGRSLEALNKS